MPQNDKPHVLIVDDSATIRSVIAKHLGEDFFTSEAENGDIAWDRLQGDSSISLIFADMHMPIMNGMVLLKQIRESQDEHIKNLPVIMITGHEDSDAAKQASYHMGATDFISKPFSATDIVSRAGSYSKLNNKITTLEENVTSDVLTALFNERGIVELGEKAVAGAHRHKFELSVLTMQIADIDEITSSYGKDITEQIIATVSNSLKESLRKEEALAHMGSGKFLLLLPMTKAFRAHIVGIRFQKSISNLAFQVEDEIIRIKLAAGLNSTEGYNDQVTFTGLTIQADIALQESLQRRACQIVRHDETINKGENAEPETIASSDVKEELTIGKELAADIEKLDTALFNLYMSAVMSREYEKIPENHIENMILPLESFLKYARDHVQSSKAKYKKQT